LVAEFDPEIPIEEAVTPPSSWYNDPDFYSREIDRVFHRGWHAVGRKDQVEKVHDYFTGRLGSMEYLVCQDEALSLRAFHNICRHRATLLTSGAGNNPANCFVCPYHVTSLFFLLLQTNQPPVCRQLFFFHFFVFQGWTYGLDGSLLKPTRTDGIENFRIHEMGLLPLDVARWGPFILINAAHHRNVHHPGHEWLGPTAHRVLASTGITDASLHFICRRVYTLECNWKVFCDNYLDGGYHVPYAHKGLSSSLQLDSYSTEVYERVSIQSCTGKKQASRLGSRAIYAFIYPNFMINRYGPWMDTNLVLPMGPKRCQVVFDYFLEPSFKDDKQFIDGSLKESEIVQVKDIALCTAVQRGLDSPAYNVGRYSPSVETAMHHFHRLLHKNLS
ncbi:hypothetical protein M569_02697, partial [Genlisea aurea]